MASAAEQMASNVSWGMLGKATELRNRLLFTIGLLIVYRIGTYIPVPGIDGVALREFMDQAAGGIAGGARHVHGRSAQPHGHLRAGDHAVHFGVDHHSVAGGNMGSAAAAQEGR